MIYNPRDHYWVVAGQGVYASARAQYVSLDDQTYQSWALAGGQVTRIGSESELVQVLRDAGVPPYHSVFKRVIVDRLHAAGLLEAAYAALGQLSRYDQERWNTRDRIYADDVTARALLTGIGADPDVILAE